MFLMYSSWSTFNVLYAAPWQPIAVQSMLLLFRYHTGRGGRSERTAMPLRRLQRSDKKRVDKIYKEE